jgi:hypothetical protein
MFLSLYAQLNFHYAVDLNTFIILIPSYEKLDYTIEMHKLWLQLESKDKTSHLIRYDVREKNLYYFQ